MSKYRVEWENDLDNAKTPLQAARLAFEEIRNGDSLAFTVIELKTGKIFSVDLNEDDGDEVNEISED